MSDTSAAWARAGARAPALSWRRTVWTVLFAALAIPGAVQLYRVLGWALRTGATPVIFASLVLHVVALAAAVGLPARGPLDRLLGRYHTRTDRLRALRRMLVAESIFFFLKTPLLTLLLGHRLQWPATFVIAVASLAVVWPLERIALAQRDEAGRLAELEDDADG